MAKQIFGYIMVVILFIWSIFGIFFCVKWETNKDKVNSVNEYIQLVEDMQDVVDSLKLENAKLKFDFSNLTTENEENKELVVTITNNFNDLQERYNALSSELETFRQKNADLLSSNEELNTMVENLQTEMLDLQNEITRLNGLLAGYEDIKNGTFEVDFFNEETLHVAKVVTNGKCVSDVEEPVKEGFDFDGWALSSDVENIVDIYTFPITENVTFVAKFTKLHIVNFKNGSEIFSTQQVRNGEYAQHNFSEILSNPDFKGFALSNDMSTLVDVSTIPITEDVTFVAVYKKFNKIYTTNTSVIGVNEIDVAGLNSSDLYRVTLTNLVFKISPNMAVGVTQSLFLLQGENGYTWGVTSMGKKYYNVVVSKGETITLTYGSDENLVTINLSVDCNVNGKLTVNYSISGVNVLCNFEITKLVLSCVEVWN